MIVAYVEFAHDRDLETYIGLYSTRERAEAAVLKFLQSSTLGPEIENMAFAEATAHEDVAVVLSTVTRNADLLRMP